MKGRYGTEAVCALLFAICVLVALVLLTGCNERADNPAEPQPSVHGADVSFPAEETGPRASRPGR